MTENRFTNSLKLFFMMTSESIINNKKGYVTELEDLIKSLKTRCHLLQWMKIYITIYTTLKLKLAINYFFSKWKEILSFQWFFSYKGIRNEKLNIYVNLYLQKDLVYIRIEYRAQGVAVKIQTGRTFYTWKWFDILQKLFNKWTSYLLTEHFVLYYNHCTKRTITTKDLFSIYEKIRSFLRICSHLLNISLREISSFYELNIPCKSYAVAPHLHQIWNGR